MFFTNPMVSPVLQLKKSDPREVGPAHASHQLIHYRGFQNGPSELTFCGSTCRTIGDSFPIRRRRRILFICLSPACVQGLWPWDGSRSQRLRRKGIGFGRRSWGRCFCRWVPAGSKLQWNPSPASGGPRASKDGLEAGTSTVLGGGAPVGEAGVAYNEPSMVPTKHRIHLGHHHVAWRLSMYPLVFSAAHCCQRYFRSYYISMADKQQWSWSWGAR